MSDRERVEALAKVLSTHVALRYDYSLTPTVYRCTCGDWQPENEQVAQKSHHQHVAEMLTDSPAMRDLLAEAKADAWDEGHKHPQRLGPDECRCGAYYAGECGCGLYGSGPLVSLVANPYRETSKEADR